MNINIFTFHFKIYFFYKIYNRSSFFYKKIYKLKNIYIFIFFFKKKKRSLKFEKFGINLELLLK